MKFDECVQLQIPESALKVSSRAVSFHPIQQKVCVALNKEVIGIFHLKKTDVIRRI